MNDPDPVQVKRQQVSARQRRRRSSIYRIDYMPGPAARAVIDSLRTDDENGTASRVIDRLILKAAGVA